LAAVSAEEEADKVKTTLDRPSGDIRGVVNHRSSRTLIQTETPIPMGKIVS